MELNNINDAPEFSKCLQDKIVTAKIVSVYDGDSIKAIFQFNNTYLKWNCRLDGIDTPEIRTRNLKEKEYGLYVRDRLRELILNKIVTLKCGELDKYGRLLVNIYIDNNKKSVNEWLINEKYGQVYTGGKKKSWDEKSLTENIKPTSPNDIVKSFLYFNTDRPEMNK